MGLGHQRAVDLALSGERSLLGVGFAIGTLPSPDAWRRYDELIPASAERLFLAAEVQAR